MFPTIRIGAYLLLLSQVANGHDFMEIPVRPSFKGWKSDPILAKDDVHVVVEVAIVCDTEFGSLFHFDKVKIWQYWNILFWDVHQRFTTLQHVNVSFWITSINVLTDAKDQPFVEDVRTVEGSVIVDDVIVGFQKWLHNRSMSWPNYDIAIAATGANITGTAVGVTSLAAVCMEDRVNGKVKSSAVVAARNTQTEDSLTDSAETVAHEIAHLLGAPHDFDWTSGFFNCWTPSSPEEVGYIMGSESNKVHSHFFSSCSDKSLSIVLRSTEAQHCLKSREDSKTNTSLQPLIDTALVADPFKLVGISVEEQCQLLLNHSSAYSKSSDTSCRQISCRLNLADGEGQTRYLRPFDGSPCNNNTGRCFRGICETPKVQLMNAATNKCLQNNDRFSANGSPKIHDCVHPFPTTMDSINILDSWDNNGMLIYMFYYSENGRKLLRKHLTVDESFVKFREYVAGDKESFGWEMIRLEENAPKKDAEFILKHKVSKMCLMAVRGLTETYALSACSVNDGSFRWKFLGGDGKVLTHEEVDKFIQIIKVPWDDPLFWVALVIILVVYGGAIWLSVFVMMKIVKVVFWCFMSKPPRKESVLKVKV